MIARHIKSPLTVVCMIVVSLCFSARANADPDDYVWDVIDIGAAVYIDRGFTYTNVPRAYVGFAYLRTANDDKRSIAPSFLTLEVDGPATVYVAYDSRAAVLPDWLLSWRATGDRLISTDVPLDLYRRDFDAGTIVLGGNRKPRIRYAQGARSMYTVLVDAGDSGGGVNNTTASLRADPSSVGYDGTSTLHWSSSNASSCAASGDWSGAKGTAGVETTGPLTASSTFTISCAGFGGGASDTVSVAVAPPLRPSVSISADPTSVGFNGSSVLNWTSNGADECRASGAWSGTKANSGSERVGPLTADSTFALSCSGAGGSRTQSIIVTVTPSPRPTVSLSANPTAVNQGDTSTLTWSSQHATKCRASGDWGGSKAMSATETVGPLLQDSVYSLVCSGAAGSASAAVRVRVTAPLTDSVALTWTPPTSNEDGTSLSDLAGYRIYYGTSEGNYPSRIELSNPGLATYVVDNLSPDTYYFVVTAFDASGNESMRSNAALKTIE